MKESNDRLDNFFGGEGGVEISTEFWWETQRLGDSETQI
jgi:hypothetical protein